MKKAAWKNIVTGEVSPLMFGGREHFFAASDTVGPEALFVEMANVGFCKTDCQLILV